MPDKNQQDRDIAPCTQVPLRESNHEPNQRPERTFDISNTRPPPPPSSDEGSKPSE